MSAWHPWTIGGRHSASCRQRSNVTEKLMGISISDTFFSYTGFEPDTDCGIIFFESQEFHRQVTEGHSATVF